MERTGQTYQYKGYTVIQKLYDYQDGGSQTWFVQVPKNPPFVAQPYVVLAAPTQEEVEAWIDERGTIED